MYPALPSIGALLGGPHTSSLKKLESKVSSAIGDSSKDSTEGSFQGERRYLEAPQGATGQDPVRWRGILRQLQGSGRGASLFAGALLWGLLSGDPEGYGKEGPEDGYHRELWEIIVMGLRKRGISLHGSSVRVTWRGAPFLGALKVSKGRFWGWTGAQLGNL